MGSASIAFFECPACESGKAIVSASERAAYLTKQLLALCGYLQSPSTLQRCTSCQQSTGAAGSIATYSPFRFNNLRPEEVVLYRVFWGARSPRSGLSVLHDSGRQLEFPRPVNTSERTAFPKFSKRVFVLASHLRSQVFRRLPHHKSPTPRSAKRPLCPILCPSFLPAARGCASALAWTAPTLRTVLEALRA